MKISINNKNIYYVHSNKGIEHNARRKLHINSLGNKTILISNIISTKIKHYIIYIIIYHNNKYLTIHFMFYKRKSCNLKK